MDAPLASLYPGPDGLTAENRARERCCFKKITGQEFVMKKMRKEFVWAHSKGMVLSQEPADGVWETGRVWQDQANKRRAGEIKRDQVTQRLSGWVKSLGFISNTTEMHWSISMAESDAPTFVLQAIAPMACGEWTTGRGTGRIPMWFRRDGDSKWCNERGSNEQQKTWKEDSKYTGEGERNHKYCWEKNKSLYN